MDGPEDFALKNQMTSENLSICLNISEQNPTISIKVSCLFDQNSAWHLTVIYFLVTFFTKCKKSPSQNSGRKTANHRIFWNSPRIFEQNFDQNYANIAADFIFSLHNLFSIFFFPIENLHFTEKLNYWIYQYLSLRQLWII